MARNESDREDLFAELKTASPRWELAVEGWTPPIVAGLRSNDRFSLYFGPDPCYHFDDQHRLRRSFAGGFLYRTQGRTLARLQRERTATQTRLRRHDLSDAELAEFLSNMRDNLRRLLMQLQRGRFGVLRQEPHDQHHLDLLQRRVAGSLEADPPLAPPFPTRRQ